MLLRIFFIVFLGGCFHYVQSKESLHSSLDTKPLLALFKAMRRYCNRPEVSQMEELREAQFTALTHLLMIYAESYHTILTKRSAIEVKALEEAAHDNSATIQFHTNRLQVIQEDYNTLVKEVTASFRVLTARFDKHFVYQLY